MKKIGICLMVVLSFILVGNTVYDFRMNSRYSVVQFQPSDMTAAKIKEEFPEIAFSEKDRTLHADVMALPEVQAALTQQRKKPYSPKKKGQPFWRNISWKTGNWQNFLFPMGFLWFSEMRSTEKRHILLMRDICQKRFLFMKNIPDGIGTALPFIRI